MASPVQYHIQTDQGPERFFRFQTLTGQYRKEQRHLDGSVTGTYGWVDPNGVLRLFDYISDRAGYRIAQKRLFKVGPAVSDLVNLPSLGGEPLQFGFEVLPLEDGINVVEVNPKKTNPLLPTAPTNIPILPQIPGLISTFGPVNPDSKQSQATVFTGPPVLPPPPPIIVIEEEPEPVVIGAAGNQLPDPPKPRTRFVIGAAANGARVQRPLTKQSAVGASAVAPRRRPADSSRSVTVIGAAANSGSSSSRSRARQPEPSRNSNRGRSGIVIGLRHNNRRKRLVLPSMF